jgi:hypothetical protein
MNESTVIFNFTGFFVDYFTVLYQVWVAHEIKY